MDIRFISSITPEDENRIAPAVLTAVAALLDRLPITYTIRIETVAGRSFRHGHSPENASDDGAKPRDTTFAPVVVERRRAG